MLVQYKYRSKQLALAIALAVGCIEISVAQQPEPQVIPEAPAPKSRKKTPKLTERVDDPPAPKEFIAPSKNAAPATNPSGEEQTAQPVTTEPPALEEPKASPTAQTPSSPTNAAVTALLASPTETVFLTIDQLDGSQTANLAKATLSSDSPVSATLLSAMRQLDSASAYSKTGRRNNAPRLAESGFKHWVTVGRWIATTKL
jgi:outer membrane biosynthesis protein TonB